MTVLDFKAMYPSVKLEPCFCHLRDFLLGNVKNAVKLRKQILELAHLATFSSLFAFDGTAYSQLRGVPMGSPVSGLLCEMVIRSLENNVLQKYEDNMIMYARYVDDVFIIWNNKPDIRQFIGDINSNIYGLELELEQQNQKRIHFLDIEIEVDEEGVINTKVYRKPTYVPDLIPWFSHDPTSYKLAAFRALIKRAYTHCSRIYDTRKELEYIEKLARDVGIKENKIKALIRAEKEGNKSKVKREKKEFTVMEYRAQLSNIYRKIGIESNKKIAYKRNTTIFQMLRNDKTPVDRRLIPGVYRIPLYDRRLNKELYYIGATKRSLNERLKEHKKNVSFKQPVTALANYAIADPTEIDIKWSKADVIQKVKNIKHLKYAEAWHIYKSKEKGRNINFRESNKIASAWKAATLKL
ncbi:uncharacterized protein LOC111633468 [Centruroides sculpturatus]|nr:uncharacterized protein LOC111633468 [Centruroides sculpturatus]XP_023233805.1 uncharacterized protein LOC111633468 [Centruroides sculpturatus]